MEGVESQAIDKYVKIQEDIKAQLNENDIYTIDEIKYVGGVDISFDKKDSDIACVYLTIYDITSSKIIYEDYYLTKMTVPYISGFLAFREVPLYLELFKKLITTKPELMPQVLFCDGCGIMHQRMCGAASHLGYEINQLKYTDGSNVKIASVGVSKTLMCVDGLDEKKIKTEFKDECLTKGSYMPLIGKSDKLWGAAFRSTLDTINPIYISIGHNISLQSSIILTSKLCKYRIPEPIRNSDIKSKLYFK